MLLVGFIEAFVKAREGGEEYIPKHYFMWDGYSRRFKLFYDA
jgi:hypothetical protein